MTDYGIASYDAAPAASAVAAGAEAIVTLDTAAAAGSHVARHADARFVQELLGHARLTTTERYMHAKARPQDVELVNLAFVPQRGTSASSQ